MTSWVTYQLIMPAINPRLEFGHGIRIPRNPKDALRRQTAKSQDPIGEEGQYHWHLERGIGPTLERHDPVQRLSVYRRVERGVLRTENQLACSAPKSYFTKANSPRHARSLQWSTTSLDLPWLTRYRACSGNLHKWSADITRKQSSLTVPTLCHHCNAVGTRLPVLLQECPDKLLKVLRRAERVHQDAEQLKTKHEGVTEVWGEQSSWNWR